jgi:GTP:adenosylcobinamide-phosphate guanylyltransferase
MRLTALVMAASRGGAADPVARAAGVTQKCLAPVAGVPMLTRVLRTLRATPAIGQVFVSIESESLLRQVPDSADAAFVASRANLADSVVAAVATMGANPWPILITTADNALHTPAILNRFCAIVADSPADALVAMTPAAAILARYPDGVRAFHRFRDGAASGCNLYALRTPRALAAVQAFAGGGQFGKKPWRLIGAFGLGTFVLHMLRRLTLEDALARAGRAFGLDLRPAILPDAEAPIDIDSRADLALAERILAERGVSD